MLSFALLAMLLVLHFDRSTVKHALQNTNKMLSYRRETALQGAL